MFAPGVYFEPVSVDPHHTNGVPIAKLAMFSSLLTIL